MDSIPPDQLTHEFFSRLRKRNFRVWLDDRVSLELQLSEVSPAQVVSASGANAPKLENFSLFFLGPPDPILPQKIYPFESSPGSRFELFIVPVGRDTAGIRYQAVFSRLVKSG